MKYKKFILSVLAVVLVASLGVVLTSCESSSPPPADTTTGGGDDITIPKVKLFENNSSVAPKLLKEVWYERTVNAHKIYVKTTFVASNYINDLRSVDTRIGNAYVDRNNTGDIWGLLLIGIDRVNKSTPKKNIINFGGLKVRTADSNFEFDALIRVNSAWNKANTIDRLPVVAENNNFLLETWDPSKNKDIEDDSWWEGVSEKKYQGGTDSTHDAADKFVSGSYTEVTNEYGETNRLDANVSYNASTGEYVITIPFTIIPFNDIDKIVVFGAQHAGWRPGATIDAVVKPLGSSRALVYAVDGVVAGIPVVKVPKSKNESPSLIPGSFPDVISSIDTSIDAKAGLATSNISVTLVSVSSNASNVIVFIGPQDSSTNYVTNWLLYGGTNNQGDYLYTNTITLKFSATNVGSPDFYAPTNYTVKVVAGNGGNATISVTVEPTITAPDSVLLVDSATVSGIVVTDGYDTPTSLIVSNTNTGSTINISGNSFTLTNDPTVADDANDILGASAGHTIVIFYDDITSGKRISANIGVIGAPSGWTLAGPGEYEFWAAKIAAVFYKTNATSLEVLVYMNPVDNGNYLYLAIDVTNRVLGIDKSTNTHDSGGDLTTGRGSFWMTNEAGIDYDFIVWGPRSGQDFDYSSADAGANRIESDGTGTDVKSSVTFTHTNLIGSSGKEYYFNIPFSAMGAASGNVVNIYVFYGQTGGTAGQQGIRSIFPANASVTAPGAWGTYVIRLTDKSPDITLP
jgi:hypothetical protein